MEKEQIEIYQALDGQTTVEVRFERDTLWLSQAQMAELFGVQRPAITKHLKNIFESNELQEDVVCSILEHTTAHGAIEGKTQTSKAKYYNLDAIISVGYRVNSVKGTQFRIWATQRLKEYLVQGCSLDWRRFDQNAAELQQALALIQKTARSPELTTESGRGLVDIVSRYTQSFLWLQRYDEGLLQEPSGHPGGNLPTVQEARAALEQLKASLMVRGEASELFARDRGEGLAAILGNLQQSVFGEPAYPTIESKAAHLLYFMVKNHPFTDGNKRSGAFLFVDFLHRNNALLDERGNFRINDTGLAALTLLVAESAAEQKEVLIRLVMNMLA